MLPTESQVTQWYEKPTRSLPQRELERAQFEHAFEPVLDAIRGGAWISRALREYPIELDQGRFTNWVNGDPERKKAYRDAVTTGLDLAVSRVMDPDTPIPLDPIAGRLEFDKIRWWAAAHDRARFADLKQLAGTGADGEHVVKIVHALARSPLDDETGTTLPAPRPAIEHDADG